MQHKDMPSRGPPATLPAATQEKSRMNGFAGQVENERMEVLPKRDGTRTRGPDEDDPSPREEDVFIHKTSMVSII